MRVPVVSKKGVPLMPTKPSRVRRWLKEGKAVKKWSDVGVFYVRLTVDPSNTQTQEVAVGVDPGKHFSGVAVQSAKATLFMAHLILPFETVKKRMEQRRTMRRTRRSRRINRNVPFKFRNHRSSRFNNRCQNKLPPSIRANRQLELRVVRELAAIFPISTIAWEYVRADVDLTSGRRKARSGKGFSPVMVGQRWAIREMEEIAPVVQLQGWETANLRRELGLVKSERKDEASPESHAVDGIALASSQFVRYESFHGTNVRGHRWKGSVCITPALFRVIRRPPICRRQLHLLQHAKGGTRRKYGGTVTRHGFRKGDFVRASRAGRQYWGWVSGDTARQVSVSDISWKRLGQFSASKVQLLAPNKNLLVSGASNPTRPAFCSSRA
uniref:RRXRR domain-containing protein n=2 Tax=Baaleninema simplex TaxID=2862350 RepID=UPI000345D7E1|nr:RRXRR domain-containing protein [Baaleninema simplex]